MDYDRFEKLCKENGVAPSAVAEAVGASRTAASGWKNGSDPRRSIKKKLAEYFGVSIGYLDGEDEPASLKKKYNLPDNMDIDDMVEAMHKNPQLGILFSRSAKMDEKALEAVLKIIDVMNREGQDGV